MQRTGLIVALLLALLLPGAASAEQASLARLERQLSAAPNDPRLLCELGWARFLAREDLALAASVLDRGIALLGEPTEPALRRRLAACLYSRGRVHEQQGAAGDAIAAYERSLALRSNEVVATRLATLRAPSAAPWQADLPAEASPDPDLLRALGARAPEDVDLLARLVRGDGRAEVVLTRVYEDGHRFSLALREAGGAWSVATMPEFISPNGSEDFSIVVGPAPPGGTPTFAVRRHWDHRTCCDEEGYPDWTEGDDARLLWQGQGGAWSVASLEEQADLSFSADGQVVLERPAADASPRLRRLLGAHPREDWLEDRP